MAAFVIKNPFVEIDGVDQSDHVRSVTVSMKAADVDQTASGDDGQTRLQGLRDDSFEFTFKADEANGDLNEQLYELFDAGTAFEVRVAKAGSVISSSNPAYAGTVVPTDWTPLDGSIGDLAEAKLSLPVSGKITRELT
jgi:hypothetical protein